MESAKKSFERGLEEKMNQSDGHYILNGRRYSFVDSASEKNLSGGRAGAGDSDDVINPSEGADSDQLSHSVSNDTSFSDFYNIHGEADDQELAQMLEAELANSLAKQKAAADDDADKRQRADDSSEHQESIEAARRQALRFRYVYKN